MKLESMNNPFAIESKKRNRTRSWNNDVIGLVNEFQNSNLDCARIPHEGYYRASNLLYTINSSIKRMKCGHTIEAHMYKGNIYLFKSKAIDREKMADYYKHCRAR